MEAIELGQIKPGMLGLVGGKALNLGAMIRAGFPVPGGFVISTACYRSLVGDLQDRAVITELALPDELRAAIVERYGQLGRDVPVAVRSSATAEDLAYASFAGQQDTYLNVIGAEALIKAVQRCWGSLWSDRAVSYRASVGVDNASVALAVVVQEMIQSSCAGVLFTANPVTGNRHETVIDASPGLGEAVVSGRVNPDHVVIDSGTGSLVSRNLGDKLIMVRSLADGGIEEVATAATGDTACVSDQQLVELSRLGGRVADHFGTPQDIEWAIDDHGKIWLTQSRPITSLYPLVTSDLPGTRMFVCLTLVQGLTRPITPMGLASFALIGSSIARAAGRQVDDPEDGSRLVRQAGQRLFLDLTPILGHATSRRLLLAAFGFMEARSSAVISALADDPRFPITSRSPIVPVLAVARVAVVRARVPVRMLTALVRPGTVGSRIDRIERNLRQSLVVPTEATADQRLDLIEASLGRCVFLAMPTVFAYPATGFVLLLVARRFLGTMARPEELQTALRGLEHNITTEMDLELWRVTDRIRHDSGSADLLRNQTVSSLVARYRRRDLPPTAQREIGAFLRRYGRRAVAEIDLGMPRWSDDPSHVVGVIQNYLLLEDPALTADAQFRVAATAGEVMVDELVQRLARHHPMRARLTHFALRRTRQLAGFRESPKYVLVTLLGLIREQLILVGASLVEAGAIDLAEDIFFCDFSEVRRGLTGASLQSLVNQRREAYAVELRRRHIPRLLLSDGTELEATLSRTERTDGALAGSPASPGVVTGRARVVLDPVGAHLEPGEILIAPSTDPGWTPLFLTAGGLVMEMGGSNSHGAVVAREYGIPAVVGVSNATTRLTTGQPVTVDGAAGLVRPEAFPPDGVDG